VTRGPLVSDSPRIICPTKASAAVVSGWFVRPPVSGGAKVVKSGPVCSSEGWAGRCLAVTYRFSLVFNTTFFLFPSSTVCRIHRGERKTNLHELDEHEPDKMQSQEGESERNPLFPISISPS
jgi:hypothetical protein